MFKQFETLVDPYPTDDAGPPPAGLWPFVWHYSRPMMPWLALMSVLTATISVVELFFFSFTGKLVDWLGAADRAGFLAAHGWELAAMAAVILVGFPAVTLGQALLMFQTTFGSYPMLVRWRAHRHMLGQSLAFFQDEFAGRVSQKVMQTSLAVRETVMKLMDVGVYVVTMFLGTAYLFAAERCLDAGRPDGVARRLYRPADLVRAAPRQDRRGPGRRARPDDRPHRRQLHQYPDGEALRPFDARAGLCPRRDGRVPGHRPQADAADHRAHLVGQRHQFAAAGGGRPALPSTPGSSR